MQVETRAETEGIATPERLIARHIEEARQQLTAARERLKVDRRRVTELEDAVSNWERLAHEMRARPSRGGLTG